MNNKITKLCYVCGTKATVTEQGKGWCEKCLDLARHNKLIKIAAGKKGVSLIGVAAEMMRERAGGTTLLKLYDIKKDLIDRLKSEASDQGMTLRELVQILFQKHLKANEVKK